MSKLLIIIWYLMPENQRISGICLSPLVQVPVNLAEPEKYYNTLIVICVHCNTYMVNDVLLYRYMVPIPAE